MKVESRFTMPERMEEIPRYLNEFMRRLISQVNGSHDGRVTAHLSSASAPASALSSLLFAKGDFVRNNSPTETGVSSSKYVLLGWSCTTDGTASGAATFSECRCLTGN